VTPDQPLHGIRIVAALSGLELFGLERENINVFQTLRAAGATIRVGVNAREDGGAVGAALRDLGFETFALPFSNQWSKQWLRQYPLSVWEKFRAVVACSRRFRQAIRELQATHVYLPSALVYSYVSLALSVSRMPLVFRMGDCPPTDSRFNLRIWRMAARRSGQIVAISDYVRRSIIAEGASADRVSVIYNAAGMVEGSDDPPGRVVAADGAWQPRLVYVGQLAEQKGVRVLVRGFALLVARFPDVTLTIVGGSMYQQAYRQEIERVIAELGLQSRVQLVGQVANPSPYYREADVHVAPSLWQEALGTVVLEAKRLSTPSVIFRTGGMPEMINHGADGVICEEKTPESLAAGIGWLLEDRERCAAAGRAARQDYLLRFGPERFARQWEAVFANGVAREVREPASARGRLV
jgi:glycosyltransferase involved in cell wall biosynthesis